MKITMKFLNTGERSQLGYKKISGHWVLGIKFDLRSKEISVSGGHLTDPSHSMTVRDKHGSDRGLGVGQGQQRGCNQTGGRHIQARARNSFGLPGR